ncbi:MAG: murein hydrolase activator EnvC [Oligoflexales bacterium]
MKVWLLLCSLCVLSCGTEELSLVKKQGPWPLSGEKTPDPVFSPFGPRIFKESYGLSSGVYFKASPDQEVYSVEEGLIVKSVTKDNAKEDLGRLLVVAHKPLQDIIPHQTVYGGLSSFSVKKGDYVQKGDLLGFVSDTGVGESQLYFEYRQNITGHSLEEWKSVHPLKILPCDPQPPSVSLVRRAQDLELVLSQEGPCLDVFGFEVYAWKKQRIVIDFESRMGLDSSLTTPSKVYEGVDMNPVFDSTTQTWKLTVYISGEWSSVSEVGLNVKRIGKVEEFSFSL